MNEELAGPSGGAAPYVNSLDHLRAELARVGTLLRIAVARATTSARADAMGSDPVFPDEGLFALLDQGGHFDGVDVSHAHPAIAEAEGAARELVATIEARREESARRGVPLRLAAMAERLRLERADLDIMLLALLVDIDRAADSLFRRLDPASRGRITAGAALDALAPSLDARLAAYARFSPRAPLLRHNVIRLAADASEARGSSLLGRAIELDERIAAYLQGDDAIDPRLRAYARVTSQAASLDDLLLPDALKQGLVRFVTADVAVGPRPIVYLQGPRGSGKKTLASALSGLHAAPLFSVDCDALFVMDDDAFGAAVRLACREAALRGATLHWANADVALDDSRPSARGALLSALVDHEGLIFLSGDAPWEPFGSLGGRPFVRVEIPKPSARDQAALWGRALGADRAPDVDFNRLTSTFRLTGGQIVDAAAAAKSLARFRGADAGGVTMADVSAACRLRHGKKLRALARHITRQSSWDDLILPADRKSTLRELCLQLKHRSRVLGEWGFERKLGPGRPLAALFSGPPGTGKTMAAGVIAAELGVDLYHIDLSRVVSKYIGETEKHLAELFADAEAANAALFFDEADSLFGKRTEVRDARDRYANLETSYLLQRIDTYEGVVILASNLVKNIDEAFVRRIGFVVEFPFPAQPERLELWRKIWPKEAPLAPEVDLTFLAERVELSGGYIRNIALAAAFLAAEEGAAVNMKHLLHAARREYQKMGKMVDAARLLYPAEPSPKRA